MYFLPKVTQLGGRGTNWKSGQADSFQPPPVLLTLVLHPESYPHPKHKGKRIWKYITDST